MISGASEQNAMCPRQKSANTCSQTGPMMNGGDLSTITLSSLECLPSNEKKALHLVQKNREILETREKSTNSRKPERRSRS